MAIRHSRHLVFPPSVTSSTSSVQLTANEINEYIKFHLNHVPTPNVDDNTFPTGSRISTSMPPSSLGFDGAAISSATACDSDPHAVSYEEANSYYAGLSSKPTLLYRTGKAWTPPQGPEAQRPKKEMIPVFGGQLEEPWNKGELGWEVVKVMEANKVIFNTSIVVRFRLVMPDGAPTGNPDDISPQTIYVGVIPGSTRPTDAHNAANAIQALLKKYEITDEVNIEFAEIYNRRLVGPQLLKPVNYLDPLVDVVGPFTTALGLPISTAARPDAQGTVAVYLNQGGGSDTLLALSCRHVLFGPKVPNEDYEHRSGAPQLNVHLLGERAFNNLVNSIKSKIGEHGITLQFYEDQIEDFVARENGEDADDAEKARQDRLQNQDSIDKLRVKMNALEAFRRRVEQDWSDPKLRVLGHIVRSPAISLGFGEHRFTRDWGLLKVDRAKLGDNFVGNQIDLGTEITPAEFTKKCLTSHDANWHFKYPKNRMLQLRDIITEELMRRPDMRDKDGEPCLIVVKNGNTTGVTIGRANGIFAINRTYTLDSRTVEGTSMEWAILNYDSRSAPFSEPGDSGSVIADIRGGVGGILTGGAGKTESSDITFATPYWFVNEDIKNTGYPDAHLA